MYTLLLVLLLYLSLCRRLVQFSNGRVAPEGAKIVYIDGAFDVFHPGHVKILKVRSSVHTRTHGHVEHTDDASSVCVCVFMCVHRRPRLRVTSSL